MPHVSRREFLEQSMFAAAALAASTSGAKLALAAEPAPQAVSPNDRIRMACIGVNGQGGNHVSELLKLPEVELVAICDLDPAAYGRQKKKFEDKKLRTPDYEADIRKLLERKDIDAVTIATPNHWHALAAIWAMEAGKDVYVEKPVSHNVSEGRRMVEVARKTGRMCQMGAQSRSMKGMRESLAYIEAGKIGKVSLAKGFCYKSRKSIGQSTTPCKAPEGVDVAMWTGPAPLAPLMRQRFHYDWHWFWAYGNGDLGNQGIHEMDKARWGLGKEELPKHAISYGGRFGYKDDGETANTQVCIFDWDDARLIFEVRGLPSTNFYSGTLPNDAKGNVGNIWYGTDGYVVSTNYQSGTAFDKDGQQVAHFNGGAYVDHFANFLKGVRSRKPSDLHAEIAEGHLSSALCHLGNVSYQLGSLQPLTSKPNDVPGDKESQATFERYQEHLRANKISLDQEQMHVGRPLQLDPKTEQTASAEINQHFTREYRKGFEVPASV